MTHIRSGALLLLTVAVVAGVLVFVPPLPQWPEYHDFADRRTWGGTPNFLDVASNALFTLVGVAGLHRLLRARRRPVFHDPRERWPWLLFFLSMVLLGPASAYYHFAPDNAGLFWDRLAMSAAFMAWLSAHLVERIGLRVGLVLLPLLIVAGCASVLYWIATEAAGAGDLRAYGLVHFYPVLLIPLLLWLFPSGYTRGSDSLVVLGLYGAAFVAERFDREIFAVVGLFSGHTLKHVIAALAAGWILRMLVLRRSS
jgi:hypothetical protein